MCLHAFAINANRLFSSTLTENSEPPLFTSNIPSVLELRVPKNTTS
jgi:hypothetical protein